MKISSDQIVRPSTTLVARGKAFDTGRHSPWAILGAVILEVVGFMYRALIMGL